MNYCLVMLRMGSISVRGKKGECMGNVRASEGRKPIDAAKNTMIDLFSTWNIMIEGFNGRNEVDGEPGTIRSHIGNLVGSVN